MFHYIKILFQLKQGSLKEMGSQTQTKGNLNLIIDLNHSITLITIMFRRRDDYILYSELIPHL